MNKETLYILIALALEISTLTIWLAIGIHKQTKIFKKAFEGEKKDHTSNKRTNTERRV